MPASRSRRPRRLQPTPRPAEPLRPCCLSARRGQADAGATRRGGPTSDVGIGHTRTLIDDESPEIGRREGEFLIPKEIRNVSFPGSMRGYDRAAVDAYVKSVNRVIAELEIGS